MTLLNQNRKGLFRKAGICALILCAVAGFWRWMRPPSVLEHATKVVTVPSWRGENHSLMAPYLWLSNGDLLFIKPDKIGSDGLFRNVAGKTPEAFYSSKALKPPGLSLECLKSIMISPDGEWFASGEYTGLSFDVTVWRNADGFHRVYSLNVDPSENCLTDLFWSIDGKTLFCVRPNGDIHRFRPSIDVKETLEIENPLARLSISVGNIIGFAKPGRLITKSETLASPSKSYNDPGACSKLELFEVGYGADKTYNEINAFKFVQNKNDFSMPVFSLSPKGDRLFLAVCRRERKIEHYLDFLAS